MKTCVSLLFLVVLVTGCSTAPPVKIQKDITVVYAFDGTGNNLKYGKKTNVYHFLNAHRTNNPHIVNHYVGGPGSFVPDKSFLNVIDVGNQVTGAGGRQLVNHMYDELAKNFREGNTGIVIVGFSRGAALAREFANVIAERGDPRRYRDGAPAGAAPKIQFIAMFDTVYSFGNPFGSTDLTYRKSIPANVQAAAHATASMEKRNTFDLWSIHSQPGKLNKTTGSIQGGDYRAEKSFKGGHNDIGGAEEENLAALRPLKWIRAQGRLAGVSLAAPDMSDFNTRAGLKYHGKGLGKRQIYFPKPGK